MAGSISKSEFLKLLDFIFSYNMNEARGVPLEKIKLVSPRIFADSSHIEEFLGSGRFFRLQDGTFCVRNRRSLGKIWGTYQYELLHPSSLTNEKEITTQIDEIEKEIEKLNNIDINANDFLDTVHQMDAIQEAVLKVIGEVKVRLEKDAPYEPEMILTDRLIATDPAIKELIPGKAERAMAVDDVLGILVSTRLVFSGRLKDGRSTDLLFFYLDMSLLSHGNDWLLSRFKDFAKKDPNSEEIHSVIDAVSNFTLDHLKVYYEKEFRQLHKDLTILQQKMKTSDYATKQQKPLTERLKTLTAIYNNAYLSFNRTKETISERVDIFNLITECKKILEAILGSRSTVPPALLKYFQSNFDFLSEKEDDQFESLMQNAISNIKFPEKKKEFVTMMWENYKKRFNQTIAALNCNLKYAKGPTGEKEYTVWWANKYYISPDPDGKLYIYDDLNVDEIDPDAFLKPTIWKKHKKEFTNLIKCHKAFKSASRTFSSFLFSN